FSFHSITITFVKTGNTPSEFSGNILFGSGTPFVEIHPDGSGSAGYTGDIGLLVTSCDITTPSTMNINMGSHNHNEFGAPGKTSTATPFSIGIQCSGSVQVSATISATADPNATPPNSAIKILPVSDGSEGLALQLLDENSNVMALNSPLIVGTVSGSHTFNWSARLVQVLNYVTGGPVQATATVTFSYQ
ncbi:fimbrial protein, partial [Enterobacter cloacae complex sp. P4RS]